MTYRARYIPRRDKTLPEYWRTIREETLSDAIKQAERYTRKGYLCVGVTNQPLTD